MRSHSLAAKRSCGEKFGTYRMGGLHPTRTYRQGVASGVRETASTDNGKEREWQDITAVALDGSNQLKFGV